MKNAAHRFTIPRKLAILSLLIVVVSLGSFAVFSLNEFRDDKLKYVYQVTNMFTRSAGTQIERVFNDRRTFSEKLVSRVEKWQNPVSSAPILEQGLKTDNSIQKVVLFHVRPNGFESFYIWRRDKNEKTEFDFSQLSDELGSHIKFQMDENNEAMVVRQVGQKVGVEVFYSVKAVTDAISQIPESDAMVVGFNGELILATSQNAEISQSLLQFAKSSPVENGSFDFESETDTFIGGFFDLKQGYTLLTQVSKNQALAQQNMILSKLGVFAVALGALAMMLSMLFIRKLSSALLTLSKYVDDLAAGRYDQKVDINTKDELEDIAFHFNRLTTILSTREKDLAKATDEANKDGLTGLWNHRFFKQNLKEKFLLSNRHKRSLSIAIIDLDNFKSINDTHGHPQGDAVLKSLAQHLTESLRETDIVCRYGGEEFVVLMPETDIKGAYSKLERVRSGFADIQHQLLSDPSKAIRVTMSVGISCTMPVGKAHMDDLISEADELLYKAKKGGKNRCVTAAQSGAEAAA